MNDLWGCLIWVFSLCRFLCSGFDFPNYVMQPARNWPELINFFQIFSPISTQFWFVFGNGFLNLDRVWSLFCPFFSTPFLFRVLKRNGELYVPRIEDLDVSSMVV